MSGPADFRDLLNSEFLDVLAEALPAECVLWTTAFLGSPEGSNGWGGKLYSGDAKCRNEVDRYSRLNSYFSVSAVRYVDGSYKRRKANFERLLALVVDDANPDDLLAPVSWVLDTSPGKQQLGMFLDGDDPDCADIKLVDALVTRMVERGLVGGDISGNNASRYVRLVQGENHKPRESGHFKVQLSQWNRSIRYTLADAASALGIDLEEIRQIAMSATEHNVTDSRIVTSGDQSDKLRSAASNIFSGDGIHESVNVVAASLVASGAHPGAVVNLLRGMMEASTAKRDERFKSRFDDIPRAVETAYQKFNAPTAPQYVDPSTGEIVSEPLFLSAKDIKANVKAIDFIIDAYLEADALSMIFGPSGVGKSFIAVDIAACVASGIDWHGSPVKKGPVFMIIGEGMNGIGRRLRAWEKKYNVNLDDHPLFVSRKPVHLSSPHAGIELAAEIDRMIQASGQLPSLIIIDTLARNFGEGDENSAKDMSKFVTNVDTYLKRRYQSNVLIVHHTGHDGERARGSSALKAALDQEFQVSGISNRITLSCTKMKDAEQPVEVVMRIEKMVIGVDADGAEIVSAVVTPAGNGLDFKVGNKSNDGGAITAGEVVKLFVDHIKGFELLSIALTCGDKAARLAVEKMVKGGLLEKHKRWYRLTEGAISMARASCWIGSEWSQEL